MARKKKQTKSSSPLNSFSFDKDERFTRAAIENLDDLSADSEDEFHNQRERALLGDQPLSSEEEQELTEEEILGSEKDSDEDSKEEDADSFSDEESDKEEKADSDLDDKAWGRHRKNFYEEEEATDDEEAKEEEKEGLRIQKQQQNDLTEADFTESFFKNTELNDDKEWEDSDVEISENELNEKLSQLSTKEKLKLLREESPEVLELIEDFKDCHIQMKELILLLEIINSHKLEHHPIARFIQLKYDCVIQYATNISFYLHLKSVNAQGLKEHPIINVLLKLKTKLDELDDFEDDNEHKIDAFFADIEEKEEQKEVDEISVEVNDSEINSDDKLYQEYLNGDDGEFDSDFEPAKESNNNQGKKVEELEEKSSKTSVPIKVDKQKIEENEEEEDYYSLIQAQKKAKIAAKKALAEETQRFGEEVTMVEEDIVEEGEKRKATYQILKNKGLIPKRKKEQRNPRVKQRNKFEKAQKKIKTIKQVAKPLKGSYGGEMTGIKANLARSVKLG